MNCHGELTLLISAFPALGYILAKVQRKNTSRELTSDSREVSKDHCDDNNSASPISREL